MQSHFLKLVRALPVLGLVAVLGACAAHSESPKPMAFQPLRQGRTSAIRASNVFVAARSASEWEAAWRLPWTDQQGNVPASVEAAPKIQFGREMVVGVVAHAAGDSCTSVEIVRVMQSSRKIVVNYKGYRHRPDEVCLTSFFSPFVFVALPSDEREVVFEEMAGE